MRRERTTTAAIFVIGFACSAPSVPADAQESFADPGAALLDSFITEGMHDWSVTGLAVAVVKDDGVVFLRGYGIRDLRTNDAVDEQTVFQIGSCSKPLSATVFATLVDDGTLKWDEPLVETWPGFRAHDPVVTEQATLRDVLCHRTGVGQDESALYYGLPVPRNELLDRLPEVRQTAPFRTEWRYSNLMFVVAGRVAEEATGRRWDDLVQERLFQPLGMSRTFTSWRFLSAIENVAIPHVRVGEQAFTTTFADQENIGPAASICSSVSDLSQWLLLMTNRGERDGRQVVQPATLDELSTPQILMSFVDPVHGSHAFSTYGLGIMVFDYHGRRLAQHSGMAGHSMAMIGFVPEDGVGVAVLTNHRPSLFHYAVFRRAIDLFCGELPVDLETGNRERFDAHAARLAEVLEQKAAARDAGQAPTLPLQEYLGTYERDYGLRATIEMESDAIVLRYGNFVADVEHWHDDTFRARQRERRLPAEQDWYLTFTIAAGEVMKLRIESEHDLNAEFLPIEHVRDGATAGRGVCGGPG